MNPLLILPLGGPSPMWKRVAARISRRRDCLDLWDRQFLAGILDQQTILPLQARELNELALWVAEYDAVASEAGQ